MNRMAAAIALGALILSGGALAQTSTHTVVFDGNEETEGSWYKIAASERLEQVAGELDGHQVTVNANDIIRGTSARGFVGSGKDGFRVWGEIIALELETETGATIYVDGEVYPGKNSSLAVPGLASVNRPDVSDLKMPREGPRLDQSEGGRLHPSQLEGGEKELVDCLVKKRRGEGTGDAKCGEDSDSQEEAAADEEPTFVYSPVVKTVDVYAQLPETEDGEGEDGKSDKGRETRGAGEIGFAGGEPSLSSVSGRRGENMRTYEFRTRALSQIGWTERFDKPCRLNLLSRVDGEKIWARILDRCGHSDTFACETETCKTDYLMVDQSHEASITGMRPAITSLRVCTNDRRNGRVKGVEVRGTEILDDGTLSTRLDKNLDTLPNCRKWEPLVICPQGSAATGVRAHFDPGKGTSRNVEQLVGLQLVCRAVKSF